MKRTLSRLTAGLLLTSLTPNMILATTGDIYDLKNNIVYTSSESNLLKDALKSKDVNENDLYIEDTDGKLYNYTEKKRAERQAIINVMNTNGIDMKDSNAFKNAIEKYASDIKAEQDRLVSQIGKIEIPENPQFPEGSQKLESVEISTRMSDDNQYIEYTIESATGTDSKEYNKEFVVEVKGSLEGNNIGHRTVRVGDTYSFRYVPDTYTFSVMEIKGAPVIQTIQATHDNIPVEWQFNEELSDTLAIVRGNPTDGYKVEYTLELYESYVADNQVILRPYSGNVVMYMYADTYDEPLVNVELSEMSGTVNVPNIPSLKTNYIFKTPDGRTLTSCSYSEGTYIPYNMITPVVQSGDVDNQRKKSLLKFTNVDTELTSVNVTVSSNSEPLVTKHVNRDSDVVLELTEGTYELLIRDAENEFILFEGEFEIKYPLPTLVYTNPQKLNGDNTESVQVMVEYKGERQPGEDFKLKFVDPVTKEEIIKTLRDGETISLPINKPLQTYDIELLDGETSTGKIGVHHAILQDAVTLFGEPSGRVVLEDDGSVKYYTVLDMTSKYDNIWNDLNNLYDFEVKVYHNTGDSSGTYESVSITASDEVLVPIPNTTQIDVHADMDVGVAVTNKITNKVYGYKYPLNPFPEDISSSGEVVVPDDSMDTGIEFDEENGVSGLDEPVIDDASEQFVEDEYDTSVNIEFEQVTSEYPLTQTSESKDSDGMNYIHGNDILLPSKDEDEDVVAEFEIDI